MSQSRSTRRWFGIAALAAFWLLGSACAGEHHVGLTKLIAGGSPSCTAYLADVEDDFHLVADTSVPGSSPAIVFDMSIPGDSPAEQILLTHDVVITLPAAFGFAGFGSAGASVGSWQFEWADPNGTFDPATVGYTIPHTVIDANHAYADTLLNGTYDVTIDSTAVHSLGGGGTHVFTITLPSGGTNNNGFGGNCSYFSTDTRFTLPAGIVTMPQTPGSYDVTIVATSVDPDTGDANDQQGIAPTVYQRTVPIQVPEPSGALAASAGPLALAALARRRSARRADPQPG
jgi:hypothetical protein